MDTARTQNHIPGQWAECPNLHHYFTRKNEDPNIFLTGMQIIFNFYEVEQRVSNSTLKSSYV